jgi:hypothetical protein
MNGVIMSLGDDLHHVDVWFSCNLVLSMFGNIDRSWVEIFENHCEVISF